MYVALMDSENYQWVGFGSTKTKAVESIVTKWNNGMREPMGHKELDDYYGITIIKAKDGECECW